MNNDNKDDSEAQNAPQKPITYRDSGVNIDAGNALVHAIAPMVRATRRPGADGKIGGFGGVFDLKQTGFNDPLLIAATDGVGTKLRVAQAAGNHSTIGIDLVAMCVNDLIVQGAEPLFFLDYFATGVLDVDAATDIVAGIAEGCQQAGCALIGGETAEMPGMYGAGDYDLAGFSVGAVDRTHLLPTSQSIRTGDTCIGLPSSGIHSNGYSLVRKLVDHAGLAWGDPAPWHPDLTVAEALLVPTRIYVKPLLSLLAETRAGNDPGPIKALAHITGGGLTENIPRVLPDGFGAKINLGSWQLPGVFAWCAENGHLDDAELLRTFNCGLGMVLCVDTKATDAVMTHLKAQGEAPVVIGTIVEAGETGSDDGADTPCVHYTGQLERG